MRHIFSRGIVVLAVRISGAGLQLVLVALAVALFPIHDVGLNAILWSTAVIARVGGTLGLDLYTLRELPSLWENSRIEFGVRCRGLLLSLMTVLAPLVVTILLGCLWLVGRGTFDRDLALAVPIVLLASAMHRLWSCQLRARGQLILSQTLDAVVLPLIAIALLVASSFWAPSLFIAGQCMAIVLVPLIMLGLLMRELRQPGKTSPLSFSEWKQVIPLGAGSALSVLASRTPILFVGAASAPQAASYEIGQRIHSAATLASSSATAVLFPRVKGLIARHDTKQLMRELSSSSILGLIPALFILGCLIVLGENRTEALIGPEYSGAWATAVVLSIAACLTAVTGLCHGVLAMAGASRTFWIIAAIQASITFAYGVFFFDGEALHMAIFALVAEMFRGAILAILTKRLLTMVAAAAPTLMKEMK